MVLKLPAIHDKPNTNTAYIIIEADGGTLGVRPNLEGDLDEEVDNSVWQTCCPFQCANVPEQVSW